MSCLKIGPKKGIEIFDAGEQLHSSPFPRRSLDNGTFSCLKNLEVLDLSNNFLTKLEGNVFAGLNNLFSLNLGGNRFTRVKKEWFLQLPRLSNLNMRRNRISVLEVGSFVGLSLGNLNLKENKIRTLHPNPIFILVRFLAANIYTNFS